MTYDGPIFVGTDKGLDTCYSATYMSQTRDQQRFTISEVAPEIVGGQGRRGPHV